MKHRALVACLGLLASFWLTLPAAAQTFQYRVLLDIDGNAASGCTVPAPSGPEVFAGADQRLTITASFTGGVGTVVSETRAVCVAGSFGAETPVSAGGWPVGSGNGVGGADVIEGFVPIADIGTANPLRVGVVALDANQEGDALFPPELPASPGIPTLTEWGALLLVALLAIAALVALRRSRARSAIAAVALLLVAVAAWAVTITLDGAVGDWAGVPQRGSDPAGDSSEPTATDIVALFTTADAVNFYVRIDVLTQFATDLALTKIVDDPSPAAGDTVTFTVTLSNNGPTAATGVQVTDQLPAGLALVSATPSQGSYDALTGVWDVGATAVGASVATLSLSASVETAGSHTNTASISHSDLPDSNASNDTASASTSTPTPVSADLALTKVVSNAKPNVGDQITFTVTLIDQGPDPATGVQVTDLLPAGLTLVSATPSKGSYVAGTGLWTVGALAVGSPSTLTIVATVVSASAQTNMASITHSDVADPNSGNNTSSVTETPQQADLALVKTVDDATPNVGDTVTFTVTLTNGGPDAATNVQVTDLLPPGLTFVSATASQGSYDSVTGAWNVGTVTTLTPQTLTLAALVVSPSAATNTAAVTHSDQFDPSTSNNSASVTVTPQQADLALVKTVDNATPNVGDTITFTVTLTNGGPDSATNVQVADLLPFGLTFVSATPSQGSYDSVTGVWDIGTVTPVTPLTLTIKAMVVIPSARTNTATITDSDQFDPNTPNNSASVTVTPQQADLALVKTVDNTTPNVGDTITFTVTLTNNGPDPATNVQVADLLPFGLTFVSATPSQGSYDSVTGVWDIGTVTPVTPPTLTIKAMVVIPSARTNTATITHSDQFDPNVSNNTAGVTETPQQADLALAKTVSNPTPSVGSNITFTVTLTNNGPDPATNVQVSDLLPPGLTFVSATPSQGSYSSLTGVWTVGTVMSATSHTLDIVATVVSTSAATNTANITHSDQFDPNTANNMASATETPP